MREIAGGHYYGNAVSRKIYPGFSVTELRYKPGERVSMHFHGNPMLSSVLKGTSTQKRRHDEVIRLPGVHRFHAAQEAHSDLIHQDGLVILIIEMQSDWLGELKELGITLDRSFDIRDNGLEHLCKNLLAELWCPDGLTHLAINGLMLEIAVRLSRKGTEIDFRNQPLWLARAVEFITESLHAHCSLAEIAAVAKVHPVHLARMFRKTYRQSVGEYIRKLRIEEAKTRLRLSRDRVVEISEALGFFDQSHFIKAFKASTGVTPEAFRKAHLL